MSNTAQIQLLDEIGFAKTVLMPGDPLRATFIAETFLENVHLINNIRGNVAYTGYYNGHKVSVMASGMGMPSMALYSYELFEYFDVENIIRVGTAGGLAENIKLRDVVAGMGSNTDSAFANQFGVNGIIAPTCSFELLSSSVSVAEELGIEMKVGNFYSTDSFYNYNENENKKWADLGSIAVEMESAALYLNAIRCKKRALAICTVSNLPLLPGNPECTADECVSTFTDMIKIALEVAIRTDK